MLQAAPGHNLNDVQLESVLSGLTLVELRAVQDSLQRLHRTGLAAPQMAQLLTHHSPEVAQWLSARDAHDAVKMTMLLGAVSVAVAWQTYRDRSAPVNDIRRAIERIEAGVSYTLPIPRHKPCFCGSETRYRDCHGRPPVAA